MCCLMSGKLGTSTEGFLAMGTHIRFLSCMSPLVDTEGHFQFEALPALRARVRVLSAVGGLVGHQGNFLSKRFPTL